MKSRYYLLLLSFFAVNSAHAEVFDLMQAWESAVSHDKDYAYAQTGYSTVSPRQKQAKALWRPNVVVNGTLGVGYQDSSVQGAQFSTPAFGKSNDVDFNTSINNGLSDRIALIATQPIYNPKRRIEQEQLIQSTDISELEWQVAQQTLILKVAQQYFDLAIAQKSLEVTQQQFNSVQKLATEMQDRFKIGSTPITDAHEAAARLAAVEAQQLSAQLDLENKKNILIDTTGLSDNQLTALLPSKTPSSFNNASVEALIAQAEAENLNIQRSKINAKLASLESNKHQWKSSVTLDAIGQVSRDEIVGSGSYGSASSRQTNGLIGLQVSIPLSTGGYREAKLEENVQLATQSQIDVDRTRQHIAQQIKQTHLQVNIGESRLTAISQALKAGEWRLDATRLGRQVGDRTTLDVLNAENEVAITRLNLIQEQVNLLMNQLRLSALIGQLDKNVLNEVNHFLTTTGD